MNQQRQLELSELVGRRLGGCADPSVYLGFLRTQSRLYKYVPWQQVFIYAQNPNVTAATTFNKWNRYVKRRIRPGSHGIAIPDLRRDNGFQFIFDIQDTYATAQSRPVEIWEFQERFTEAVTDRLHNIYDEVPSSGPPSSVFYAASRSIVQNRMENGNETYAAFLPMLGEDTDLALELVELSVYFEILNRCGMEPREHYDFSILNQNLAALMDGLTVQQQAERIYALACLTGTVATELLKSIENTVKQEQQKEFYHERTDLSQSNDRRHESAPAQPYAGREERGGENPGWPLGAEASGLPGDDEPVRAVPDSGNATPAPGRNSDAGRGAGAEPVGQPAEAGEAPRPADPAPGMGAGTVKPSQSSGRDRSPGADSGVSRTRRRRRRSALDGQIQIAMEETPVGIPQEVFDEVLRLGSNQRNSILRIVANHHLGGYELGSTGFADFLRKEFVDSGLEGGRGIVMGRDPYAVWFDADGIQIAPGNTVRSVEAVHFSWQEAADRIDDLIASGSYISSEITEEAIPHERLEVAESLWYLHSDLEAGTAFFLEEDLFYGRGFPDSTQMIADMLADPLFLAQTVQGLREFAIAYRDNPSILRFHTPRHNPAVILERLYLLQREPTFHVSRIRPYEVPAFITEDEIDATIGLGGGHSESKQRIYRFFQETAVPKERADFLKQVYGTGGRSHSVSYADNSFLDYDSSGMVLRRGKKASIKLKWNAVAKRIDTMIQEGRYLSPAELAELEAQEEEAQIAEESEVGELSEEPEQDVTVLEPTDDTLQEDDSASADIDEDVRWCLIGESGMMDADDKQYFAGLIRSGVSNTVLAQRLSETFNGLADTVILDTGEEADYYAEPGGLRVEIQDKYATTRFESWESIAAVLRRYQEQGLNGFLLESELEALGEQRMSEREIPEEDFVPEEEGFQPDLQENQQETEAEAPEIGRTEVLQPLSYEAAQAYAEIKAQRLHELVGFEQNGYYEFYNEDAQVVADILGSAVLQKVVEDGNDVPVSGFRANEWNSRLKDLWRAGNDVYLTRLEDGQYVEVKHVLAEDYLPVGTVLTMPAMSGTGEVTYTVEGVDFDEGLALLNAPDGLHQIPVEIVRSYYEEQMDRQPMVERPPEPQSQPAPESPSSPTFTTEPVEFYPAGPNRLPYDVVIERLHIEEPEPTPPQEPKPNQTQEPVSTQEPAPEPNSVSTPDPASPAPEENRKDRTGNFRILDNNLGAGGPKAKYEANVTAIRLLKTLEAENRPATAQEQEQLSRYVGWGGVPDAFDEHKAAWAQEFRELKDLLTPAEYKAARESVLNSHYTSPTVIRAIYDAVQGMGFEGGRILEPSMGVGNFFGMLPEALSGSELYGVELDSITGRIAQKLYPDAHIKVAGFETTKKRDFYDLAVGNVPFGQYQVHDVDYNRLGFNIHNYFVAKALDQVRPGGVVAFVTSRFTMDSRTTEVRRYLAERAELLGAIRLPNNAFRANAGTDVVSDILFLQRRDDLVRLGDQLPAWVETAEVSEGVVVNRYFAEHPEMVLGTLELESTRYGQDVTCNPIPGAVLSEQLRDAVSHLPKDVYVEEAIAAEDLAELPLDDTIDADESVRNFSYTLVGDEVYYRENDLMTRQELKPAEKRRIVGMIGLRDTVRQLIQCQLDGGSDAQVQALQTILERQYDEFFRENGRINDRRNAAAFNEDSSYYLLTSLENYKGKEFVGKSDLFTKRTIRQNVQISHCETPMEALAVSMNEYGAVNLRHMAGLLDMTEADVVRELEGQIYPLPESLDGDAVQYVTASEYLSGNIQKKLDAAKERLELHLELAPQIAALEKALPEPISAADIDVHLGATWVPVEYINAFILEEIVSSNGRLPLEYRYNPRRAPYAEYSPLTSTWRIEGKTADSPFRNQSRQVWGVDHKGGYALNLLEACLNLKEVKIQDTVYIEGQAVTRVDEKLTAAAHAKQAAMQERFADWVFADPERRAALEHIYNDKFNSIRPREYDGSYMTFPGMAPSFQLRPHQSAAVAHALYGGNTLFAHTVGAGKTAEMIATAMEGKRLGLHHKSLFVVPKHTIEQFAKEFMRVYPAANILVSRPQDFTPANRKKFCARIAAGDYDAIIMSFSQFEKVPLSAERQEEMMTRQIDEIVEARAEAEIEDKGSFSTKQLVAMEKRLTARLEKLLANERKDDVITFEELGVDKLFVDEAHYYKNSFIATKMTNVAGIGQSASQKCTDLEMKCQYLDELTGSRGVVFATGTPVSNTMSELYVMQRYLQRTRLEELGLGQFDNWASTFGQTEKQMELAPEGSGYRMKTRFSKFYNVPELMQLFRECADVKMAGDLKLDVPEVTFHNIVAQPTPEQKEMVAELSKRAEAVHNRSVTPDEDNMLKITSDGRKIGLDARMMDPSSPDEAGSKINLCVENVLRIWKDTAPERLTQIIFSDFSTPNPHRFNAYHDIRSKLVAKGVPEQEIAFIHDYNTDAAKADLFAKVRSGEVRILLGSTQKLGVGTNVQTKLIATHDLDAPVLPLHGGLQNPLCKAADKFS